MSSLFAKARDWLPAQMQAAAVSGNTLTYTRTGHTVLTLTNIAWEGRTVFATNVEGGARIEFGDRDYLIPVESLVLTGTAVEPAIGDRITETIDGTATIFEVMLPDTGEPAWRYSGPDRNVWRIHTKEVQE